MKCIQFKDEKKYIKDFLSLPKTLYKKDKNMENPKEVEKLLLGNHPVSSYVTLHKFVIYKENKPFVNISWQLDNADGEEFIEIPKPYDSVKITINPKLYFYIDSDDIYQAIKNLKF